MTDSDIAGAVLVGFLHPTENPDGPYVHMITPPPEPPDDRAVELFALWLLRGWNDPEMILWRIQRYARITLLPIEHAGSSEAHFGLCNDAVWLDGTNTLGLR